MLMTRLRMTRRSLTPTVLHWVSGLVYGRYNSETQATGAVMKIHEVGHLKHLSREHFAVLHDVYFSLASQAVQHIMFVTHHMSLTAALHKEQNSCLVPLRWVGSAAF